MTLPNAEAGKYHRRNIEIRLPPKSAGARKSSKCLCKSANREKEKIENPIDALTRKLNELFRSSGEYYICLRNFCQFDFAEILHDKVVATEKTVNKNPKKHVCIDWSIGAANDGRWGIFSESDRRESKRTVKRRFGAIPLSRKTRFSI